MRLFREDGRWGFADCSEGEKEFLTQISDLLTEPDLEGGPGFYQDLFHARDATAASGEANREWEDLTHRSLAKSLSMSLLVVRKDLELAWLLETEDEESDADDDAEEDSEEESADDFESEEDEADDTDDDEELEGFQGLFFGDEDSEEDEVDEDEDFSDEAAAEASGWSVEDDPAESALNEPAVVDGSRLLMPDSHADAWIMALNRARIVLFQKYRIADFEEVESIDELRSLMGGRIVLALAGYQFFTYVVDWLTQRFWGEDL